MALTLNRNTDAIEERLDELCARFEQRFGITISRHAMAHAVLDRSTQELVADDGAFFEFMEKKNARRCRWTPPW